MFSLYIALIHLYSLVVLMAPLEREFGWARAQISSGLLPVAKTLGLSPRAAPLI